MGAAARVPHGDLRRNPAGEAEVGAAGVVPVAMGRVGISETVDLGVVVAGPVGGLGARHSTLLIDDSIAYELTVGATALAGAGGGTEGGGVLYAVDVPVTLGIDVASFARAWLGVRLGLAEHTGDRRARLLRAGAVVGGAFGFRHLHALVELDASWESWSLDVQASGLALTPSFALQLRI